MLDYIQSVLFAFREFASTHERNLEWVLVLFGSILLSLYGVAVPNRLKQRTHPRCHNGIKLFNDFLARHQLSYLMFFLTLVIAAQLGNLSKKFCVVLVLLSAFFYYEGVSQSTDLGDSNLHDNCDGPKCKVSFSFVQRFGFCKLNIFFSSLLLLLAIVYSFLA
jgi:hypothetical protein